MLLLENISTLVTVAAPDDPLPQGYTPRRRGAQMGQIGVLRNADLAIEGDRIAWIGASGSRGFDAAERIDCSGRTVLPGLVDSHTHMVFAGERSGELARRLRGATYQQIAAEGGGIQSTVRAVRSASTSELVERARRLVRSAFRHGTTTLEIKSGYGLDTASELRQLDAIARLATEEEPTIIPTFMGAHDVPPEHREDRAEYIRIVIDEMLPIVAERRLAAFCDVFCDTGYFTISESEQIFEAARHHGLRLKIHADELSSFGGAELAARAGAISADHLLMISDNGIEQMRSANVIATLLPGTAFFLGLPFAPARRMIESGLAVALATDCNPGSNMSENMQMTIALACMGMKMTVEEAICAATLNGAAALGISDRVGSIEVGKIADLAIFDAPEYPDIVYHYGVNRVCGVVSRGRATIW
jgi:imidazolonepropionase